MLLELLIRSFRNVVSRITTVNFAMLGVIVFSHGLGGYLSLLFAGERQHPIDLSSNKGLLYPRIEFYHDRGVPLHLSVAALARRR